MSSLEALRAIPEALRELSVIPAGKLFQWGARRIQERIPVSLGAWEGVELEPVATSPRIFVVHGLFSAAEADMLIDYVGQLKGDFALGPSGVGLETEGDRDTASTRTSHSAFDVESSAALAISRRAFEVTRVPFDDDMADGLQILRYDEGEAYISHLDWFEAGSGAEDENLDTTTPGSTNRFATVVLYLSSPDSGGFTVFPLAKTESSLVESDMVSTGRNATAGEAAMAHARTFFDKKAWEMPFVEECFTHLAVKPKRLGAVLFYHQDPLGGELLEETLHGGCPAFGLVKWAANMWIWNAPRALGARSATETAEEDENKLRLVLTNTGGEDVDTEYSVDAGKTWVHYEKLMPGNHMDVHTFVGVAWRILEGSGREIRRVVMPPDKKTVRVASHGGPSEEL